MDETGYRRMLENTTIDRGTKQTFMNKVLCGGGEVGIRTDADNTGVYFTVKLGQVDSSLMEGGMW